MLSLTNSQIKLIRKKMASDGIYDVIDAQNIREYIKQKRSKNHKSESGEYNNTKAEVNIRDEVLDKLSLNDEESKALFHMLQDNSIRKDKSSIRDIDWKKLKTF